MATTALIIGITGQDGAYLARHLLGLGYYVVGTSRDSYVCDTSRLARLNIIDDVEIISMCPSDFRSVLKIFFKYKPDHVYNLAGLTSVGLSFELPLECLDSISTATNNLLEAIKFVGGDIRFFNAGSSECFGDTSNSPADEQALLKPQSPYAVAKSAAFWQVKLYRKAYNVHCCTGILSNHESPLRPKRFVIQKLVCSARDIANGVKSEVMLGNLDIYRDWGWAADYVSAMHLILTEDIPDDYIVATGTSHHLMIVAEMIFNWHDLNFHDFHKSTNELSRPSDLKFSSLNNTKIKSNLGWSSTLSLEQLVDKLCSGHLV